MNDLSQLPEFITMPDRWMNETAQSEYEGLKREIYELQREYQDKAQPMLDRMSHLAAEFLKRGGMWVKPEWIAKPTCET